MARVLLVEDESNIASIIVFKLEREGHEVHWESRAVEVAGTAEAFMPELVLLDSSLPDGDSFSLLSLLTTCVPVVVMVDYRYSTNPGLASAVMVCGTVEMIMYMDVRA